MDYVSIIRRKVANSKLVKDAYEKVVDSHACSHPYKDGQVLPNGFNISNREAGIYYLIINILGLTAFIISFIAYSQFDSLKSKVISIEATYAGDNCRFLVRYTENYGLSKNLSEKFYSTIISAPYNTRQTFVSGSTTMSRVYPNDGVEVYLEYQNAFFDNYNECLSNKFTCSQVQSYEYTGQLHSSTYGLSSPFYDAPSIHCHYTDDDRIRVADLVMGDGTGNDVATQVPYTSDMLTTEINTLLPSEEVCKPFLDNPPYQCAQYEELSALSVLSQSLSIASGIVWALVTLSSLLLAQVKGELKSDIVNDNDNDDDKKDIIISIMKSDDDDDNDSSSVPVLHSSPSNSEPFKQSRVSLSSSSSLLSSKKATIISKTLVSSDIDMEYNDSDDDDNGDDDKNKYFAISSTDDVDSHLGNDSDADHHINNDDDDVEHHLSNNDDDDFEHQINNDDDDDVEHHLNSDDDDHNTKNRDEEYRDNIDDDKDHDDDHDHEKKPRGDSDVSPSDDNSVDPNDDNNVGSNGDNNVNTNGDSSIEHHDDSNVNHGDSNIVGV